MSQPLTNQHAPWTSEQPPRNPNVPRSDITFFDPATDPVDYSAFVHSDVDFWAAQNTDPNFLVSPNEPVMPPQDLFSMATHNMMHQQQRQQQQPIRQLSQGYIDAQTYASDISPVEFRVQRASPSPDSQNLVDYTQTSTLRTDSYTTVPRQHPSPIATSIESPVRMALQSPATLGSPLASASSPGGSEGMFSSYQPSDPGTDRRASQSHQSFDRIVPPPASVISVEFSPNRTFPDAATGVSPDPEGQIARRQVGPIRSTGRPGGRALGTHLEPRVAQAAHNMRKTVACWHCVLQRDKVNIMILSGCL